MPAARSEPNATPGAINPLEMKDLVMEDAHLRDAAYEAHRIVRANPGGHTYKMLMKKHAGNKLVLAIARHLPAFLERECYARAYEMAVKEALREIDGCF